MKNKLSDLNNHLFAALERVNDEDLAQEDLAKEIERAKAVSQIATQVIANAKLGLDAAAFLKGCGRDYDSASAVLRLTGGASDEHQD